MSIDELKSLDEENDSLDQFVNELPHIQCMKQTVVDMINATEELEGEIKNFRKYFTAFLIRLYGR